MPVLDIEHFVQRPRPIPMSEDAFFKLDGVHAEYVDGKAEIMSPVSLRHSTLSGWLVAVTNVCAQQSYSGDVFGEPVVCRTVGGQLRSPDISFVKFGRPGLLQPNLIDGAPDLIMEIVSPESRDRDNRVKYSEYEASQVRECWVFDPQFATVDLHRLNAGGKFALVEPNSSGLLTSDVLPYFEFAPVWLHIGQLPSIAEMVLAIVAKSAKSCER